MERLFGLLNGKVDEIDRWLRGSLTNLLDDIRDEQKLIRREQADLSKRVTALEARNDKRRKARKK